LSQKGNFMAIQPQKNEEKVKEEKKTSSYSTFTNNRGWLYGLLALIAVVLIFMAGAGLADHHRGVVYRSGNIASGPGAPGGFREHGFMMGGGFGGNVTVNGQSRDEGVVTSVSGNNFTLAGHGATANVTTNSSTQYQGGNTVKQNDTVVVYGTQSNGTLTATQVVINP
jgi:hypothetical protein